jgi:hypothetical protein
VSGNKTAVAQYDEVIKHINDQKNLEETQKTKLNCQAKTIYNKTHMSNNDLITDDQRTKLFQCIVNRAKPRQKQAVLPKTRHGDKIYFDRIREAIVTLKDLKGTRRQEIQNSVAAKMGDGFIFSHFSRALKTAVEHKKLTQNGDLYKVALPAGGGGGGGEDHMEGGKNKNTYGDPKSKGVYKSKTKKRKSNKTRKRRRKPSKQRKHKKSKKPKTKRNPNKRKTKRK